MPARSPSESEFASTEEAEAHDVWFRAKVREAMDDPTPPIPHDEVVRRVKATIQRHRTKPA